VTSLTPRSDSHLRRGLVCVALLALWALATGVRWRHLHEVTLGSDALGQFLGAWTVISGGAPVPPNPEGGHSLWLWGLPCVLGGSSLEQVFAIRFALGALVAPVGALAAALLSGGRRRAWLAGALAGVVLAWDPGLVDTLVVSFRGYGAPELISMALLGAAVGGRLGFAMGAVAFVGATGQHPMSTGVGLGLLALLAVGKDRKHIILVAVVAGLCALPRLHWLWQLGSCGAGLFECLGNVATGSAEPGVAASEMLRRAFWDRGVVELGLGASLAVLAGVVAAATHRHGRRIALAAVLAVVGVLAIGLAIQGLRPCRCWWSPRLSVFRSAPRGSWSRAAVLCWVDCDGLRLLVLRETSLRSMPSVKPWSPRPESCAWKLPGLGTPLASSQPVWCWRLGKLDLAPTSSPWTLPRPSSCW